MLKNNKRLFFDTYPDQASLRMFFAPGRINLIGEHIDYNGGYVLPIAIDLGTTAYVALRNDSLIQLKSLNFDSQVVHRFSLEDLSYSKSRGWCNYVLGVVQEIHQLTPLSVGFDCLIEGDLPHSSGLSSSASIEVLTASMLNVLYQLEMDSVKIATLCQAVENQYIGVNCGIMDQMIIANAIANHAMLLNTQTLVYEHIPFQLADYDVVITNSMLKRKLVDSLYNQRRLSCLNALEVFRQKIDIQALCELSMEQFESLHPLLENDQVPFIRHVVSEQERTLQAVAYLKNHQIMEFSHLLTQTHSSLQKDYQVSISPIDLLVELALEHHALGSRMTGAGFGGCTISIVKKNHSHVFMKQIEKKYYELTKQHCHCFLASSCDGAKEITE